MSRNFSRRGLLDICQGSRPLVSVWRHWRNFINSTFSITSRGLQRLVLGSKLSLLFSKHSFESCILRDINVVGSIVLIITVAKHTFGHGI